MDVSAAGISAFQQAQLKDQVGISVMRKVNDSAKQQAAQLLSLMQPVGPSEPGKGGVIDVRG